MSNDVTINIKANTAQAQSAMSSLNKSWIGLNAGLEIAQKGAQVLGQAYKALVGDTMEYAAQVRQVMRVSGQNAEMTSRMIQLTDDFAISNETLTQAMKGATSNGIAFTVDALAKLSDEYVKLKPGLEQATFAAEKFGARAGPEMQKLLEKGSAAIIAQGEAQSDNLIMTQANLDKAEELRIAEDNLADSMKGIGNVLGNWVIPKLVDAANGFETLLTWEEKLDKALKEANETNIKGAKSYEKYVEGAKYQAKAAGLVTREINGQLVVLKLLPHGVTEVSDSLRIMSAAEWEASRGAAEADKRLMQWGNTIRTTTNTDIPNANAAIDAMGQRYQAQATMIIEANQKAAASIREDIAKAMGEAQAAADSWIKGAGGDVAGELKNADLSAGEYNKALIALDGAMGTNTYQAKLQQEATNKIVKEYERTKDVDAFTNSLQRLKNGGFIPLLDDVKTAREQIALLYADLRLLDGTFTAHVVLDIPTTRSTPDPRGGGHATDPDDDNFATGGSYTVPGGYYENYPVGIGKYASSGETVTITPAGQTTNMGGIIININGARSPGATADAVALRLAKYGKQYQGQ